MFTSVPGHALPNGERGKGRCSGLVHMTACFRLVHVCYCIVAASVHLARAGRRGRSMAFRCGARAGAYSASDSRSSFIASFKSSLKSLTGSGIGPQPQPCILWCRTTHQFSAREASVRCASSPLRHSRFDICYRVTLRYCLLVLVYSLLSTTPPSDRVGRHASLDTGQNSKHETKRHDNPFETFATPFQCRVTSCPSPFTALLCFFWPSLMTNSCTICMLIASPHLHGPRLLLWRRLHAVMILMPRVMALLLTVLRRV